MSEAESHPDREHHAFIGSAKLIAGCSLVSMVLGAVRDVLMAAYFGGGLVLSAFWTAWTIPNLFRRLFGEGAASSALVPTFTASLKTRPDDETQRLFSVTFTMMFLFLSALTLLIEAVVNGLLWWGDFGEKGTLLLQYTAVLMPYMVLICLTAFFMAVLNAHRHFFAPAMMPVILNVVWIAAVYLLSRTLDDREAAGRWLCMSVLVGGALQLFFLVPFAWKRGVRLSPSLEVSHPGFRQVVVLWLPVIIGSAAVQINALLDRGLAYFLVEHPGSASFLFFGNRLMHFPISLIGTAIATAVLPALSEHAATGDLDRFKRMLLVALRFTLFLAIPASVGLMALFLPVVEVIYRHGEFTHEAAVRTAWVVFYYSISVWAYTGVFVLLRAFYAFRDTRTPVRVAAVMVGLNLALNLTLIWFLEEAGLALATSISGVAQFVVLLVILRRRIGPLGGRDAAAASVKVAVLSVVMGVLAALGWHGWWPVGAGILTRVLVLAALTAGAAGVFAAGAAALGLPELKQVLRFRRR